MPDWLQAIVVTTTIGLQGWVLVVLYNSNAKMAEFRAQLGRIISDIESEKGTRKRVHETFDARIRSLEIHHKPK